jgi:hypothetical protein
MSQVFWIDDEQLQDWQKEILKREFNEQRKGESKGRSGSDRSIDRKK